MNSLGRLFRVSVFGESHGSCVGVLVDGCPSGIPLSEGDMTEDLRRRRSGARGTTPRRERDLPLLESGVYRGRTTGAPILIRIGNEDRASEDYLPLESVPRPGHADLTARAKYRGWNDPRGGGHFSGRLTAGLVAAGVIARKVIRPVEVSAALVSVGGSKNLHEPVQEAMARGDSVGGIVECRAFPMPVGLGEPFFDSVESLISHAVFAVPGVRGIEFGDGFRAGSMTGSRHNDPILDLGGTTALNHAGGVNGGISNGNELRFRAAIKPTASIALPQRTLNLRTGRMEELRITGRHDACFALRCPVILEAVTAMVLADLLLCGAQWKGPGSEGDAAPPGEPPSGA